MRSPVKPDACAAAALPRRVDAAGRLPQTKLMTRQELRVAAASPRGNDPVRDRLIAAAYRVLASQGFEAATLKEIAREAATNQGLIHYYFGSKDNLLLEVVKVAAQKHEAEFEAIGNSVEVTELNGAMLAASSAILMDRPDEFRLLVELVGLGLRRPELRQGVADLLAETRELTARLLARGQGRTEVRQEDELLAMIFRAVFDGLAIQSLYAPDLPLDRAITMLESILRQERPPRARRGAARASRSD